MSQQGAALQTYNNELVKCKFVLFGGCFMAQVAKNRRYFEERFPRLKKFQSESLYMSGIFFEN